jgi:hypothetical protein
MSAQHTPGPRAYVTKSRSNHYTVTLRDRVTGVLVNRIEKLADIHAARAAIAKATEGAS